MRFLLSFTLILSAACALAQQGNSPSTRATPPEPAQPSSGGQKGEPGTPPPAQPGTSGSPVATHPSGGKQAPPPIPVSKQQPKRILGIMPNYRAVSAGAIPPPPTLNQAFKIATQNNFDYSAFVNVGLTSLFAEGRDEHPPLRKGPEGFGRYYWRGFVDRTDGNYLVLFALPTVFHQDERYFARGEGSFWKRGIYAASRILITPNYVGHNGFNASELLGRGVSQGISAAYYPRRSRTAGALGVKFGYAVGRDALTNVIREFWPDIATHISHRHA